MTESRLPSLSDLPNVDPQPLRPIVWRSLAASDDPGHPPRILLLYGSLREWSYSRFASEEAGRLLRWFGAETRTFNPKGLPLTDETDALHPKVKELRDLAT